MSFPRESFSFCSTNKIQRLIDFHHFLSKSNNEPSQLEFYSKRSLFCFLSWRKLLIGWGNVSLKRYFLWWSWVLSTTLLSKTFVHRWETLTDFIFQRSIDKIMFVCSRQVKRPIDVFSLCSTTNSNKEKFDDIWWRLFQSLMLNGKSYCDNFTRNKSSSKTQIVRRIDFQQQSNDKIARRKVDWKKQRFFFKASKIKIVFSSFEYFYPKWKNDRKIFLFQPNQIDEKHLKKEKSLDRPNSLQ